MGISLPLIFSVSIPILLGITTIFFIGFPPTPKMVTITVLFSKIDQSELLLAGQFIDSCIFSFPEKSVANGHFKTIVQYPNKCNTNSTINEILNSLVTLRNLT